MAEGKTLDINVGANFGFLQKNFDVAKAKRREKQGYVLEGSGGCFDRDQLVITDNGSKGISQIKVGDKVLSYNEETGQDEYKEVLYTYKHNNDKPCIAITLNNGLQIWCTIDHEFYDNGKWIHAIDLVEKWDKVALIRPIELTETFDITVEDNENYYLDCGEPILVHNSGKTYDVLQFIIYYCELFPEMSKDILVTRETYAQCQKTVLKDFIKILKMYGLYDNKCHKESHPQQYRYKGNTISFTGLDDSSAHGDRRDFIYFNELLLSDDDKAYKQLQGRCSEVFIVDYNPIYTIHWVYDQVINRPDTKFFKSTFLQNPYLSAGERAEKLAYEPTPQNIANGTADEYMWKVYALGERAAREGLVFKYVKWIAQFPDNVAYSFGMDFGYVQDPTAITRVFIDHAKKEIYAELLCYEPIDNPAAINDFMNALELEKHLPIIADSADKYISQTKGAVEMVKELKKYGWNIHKVSKTHDKYFWLTKMMEYQLIMVSNINLKKEFENYMWRSINGMQINQPIDKWNHAIDSIIYNLMSTKDLQKKSRMWNQ